MKYEPRISPFRRLSASEEFAARLPFDSKQKGRESALENRPRAEASAWSAPELDILDMREVGQHELQAASKTVVYEGLQQMQELAPTPTDVPSETVGLLGTVAEVRMVHAEDIAECLEDELDAEAQRNAFRDEHGLVRDARYSPTRIIPILIMLLLALPETLVSTVMLKEVVRGGYTGGAILALTAGALTVILGWLSGTFGVRQIRHIRYWRKLVGTLALIAGSFAGFLLQLNLAHTRDVIARGSHDLSLVKILVILSRPSLWLDFSGPAPLMILLLGLVIFALAVMKGSGGRGSFVDPYPGYDDVDTDYQTSHSRRIAAETAYREGIVNAHLNYRDEFHQRIVRDLANVIKARLALKDVEMKLGEIQARAEEWDRAALQAIRDFRTTNTSVRSRGKPPAYFDQLPNLSNPLAGLEDGREIKELIEKFQSVQTSNEAIAPRVVEAISRAQEQAVQKIPDELNKLALQAEMRVKAIEAAEAMAEAGPEESTNSS